MRLYSNWRYIVRKAWSVRLMFLAGMLTSCEVILPIYTDVIPRGIFSILTIIAVTGGLIARIVAQKGLE